jgi:FHA domain
MGTRISFRHSTGSKASTVEEFPVTAPREFLFGRDPSCDIRFDQDRDEFVSRRHMKLVVGDPDRLEFTVVDLGARNGTFINRRRVTDAVPLKSGDVVQLGAGGPEFIFEVNPEDLKLTPRSGIIPVADFPEFLPSPPPPSEAPRIETAAPRIEQEVNVPTVKMPLQGSSPPPPQSRPKIAKHRMARKQLVGVGVLIIAALAWAAYYATSPHTNPSGFGAAVRAIFARVPKLLRPSDTPAPEEVVRQNASSLVTVETVWRLVDPATGRPLKQIYIPNRRDQSDSTSPPLIPNAGPDLPVFVLLVQNRLQPLLTVADQSSYQAIRGTKRNAGFTIASDHLILTSRSVASPWRVPYDWPASDMAGIVAVFDEQFRLAKTAIIARRQFPRWLPVDTDYVLENTLNQNSVKVNRLIHGRGLLDSLTVHVSGRLADVPASLVKESDETGFAAIRLDAQVALRGLALETEGKPKVGDALLMVVPAEARPAMGTLSAIDPGDRYDIAVGTSETPGVGTPIFDRRGRVVAVQAESDPLRPGRAVAISIRRALESLGQASAAHRQLSSAFRVAKATLRNFWQTAFL